MNTPLKVLQAPSRDAKLGMFWAEFSPDVKRDHIHASGHVMVWNTSSWTVEDSDAALY